MKIKNKLEQNASKKEIIKKSIQILYSFLKSEVQELHDSEMGGI